MLSYLDNSEALKVDTKKLEDHVLAPSEPRVDIDHIAMQLDGFQRWHQQGRQFLCRLTRLLPVKVEGVGHGWLPQGNGDGELTKTGLLGDGGWCCSKIMERVTSRIWVGFHR